MYTETCEATRLRDEQPEEIMVLKMGCLDKHLMNAGALMKVFGEADKTVVEKAVQAVSSLSGFSNCNDVEALQSRIPPPKDEQTKNKVAAIREKLAEVEALEKTGKYRKGLNLVRKLEEEAKAVDYRPVQAELMYLLGVILSRTGNNKVAETALYDAARAAGDSKDVLLAAKALTWKVWVVGYLQANYKEALALGEAAEILLDLSGNDDAIRSRLLHHIVVVLAAQGKYDKAQEYSLRSLAIRTRFLGNEHPQVAASLNSAGLIFSAQGKFEKALEYLQKSLAIMEKTLGPAHPNVSAALANIGRELYMKGEYESALEYLQKSLAIDEKALGPEHPDVASSLNNLGALFQGQGKYDKAIDYFRKALAIREKTLVPEHPLVAETLSDIGKVFVGLGRPEQSLKPLERVALICKKKLCDPYPYGHGLFGLAQALVATGGDKARAIKLAKQAQKVFGKTPKAFMKELEEVDEWLKKHDSSNQRSVSAAKR